ncbi:Asp-tRNA(Asn)/Glu-tRNA(Gln) amidotransferase subunit GatB, partial [Candidatus Pacearchaeota archaeon]|nr:Asp-tRNA(Asn)/Glu-tRNA(Gln) amidotransferase subunit GatB [Candidatus Pacearchaeota archaeon]
PMNPNLNAIKQAVRIGLMLNCAINKELIWKRKHYDWPDLPKGYQNTLSGAGAIPVGQNGKFLGIKIGSMHLEEDPASWNPKTGEVDYNRSGLPLVEIVTEPDFSTAEEVMEWLGKLTHALSYLKAVDSNAGIKVDVNVNIPGETERVEIKNLNSIESIGKAINFEFERQMKEGGKHKETRRYDEAHNRTMVMRSKEESQDYRFISDPDLRKITINNKMIDELKNSIPESPERKLEKLVKKYKIDKKNAEILSKNIDIAEFFEKVAEKVNPEFALPWVSVELLRFLHYTKKRLDEAKIETEHFIALLRLVQEGKITPLKGKDILNSWNIGSSMPIDTDSTLRDEKELQKILQRVLQNNRKAVEDYCAGSENALNFLMGQVMKETNKRAEYGVARKLLLQLLQSRDS